MARGETRTRQTHELHTTPRGKRNANELKPRNELFALEYLRRRKLFFKIRYRKYVQACQRRHVYEDRRAGSRGQRHFAFI